MKDLFVNAWPTLSTNAGKKGGTYVAEIVALKGDINLLQFMLEEKPDLARWHFEYASKHMEKDKERLVTGGPSVGHTVCELLAKASIFVI